MVVAGNEKLKDGLEIRLPGAEKKGAETPKRQAGNKGDAGR